MLKAAVSVPGTVYSAVAREALRRSGDFEARFLTESEPRKLAEACAAYGADLFLLFVSVASGYRASERGETARLLREMLPACKIVVLVDDGISDAQTEGVKRLKQSRLIDSFVYASCTIEYLAATLETII